MTLLTLVALGLALLVAGLVDWQWWRLSTVPPLDLLPLGNPGAEFLARAVVLLGLLGLVWEGIQRFAPIFARLRGLANEPDWAAAERLMAPLHRPIDLRPLLWAALAVGMAGLLLPVVLGPQPQLALPAILGGLLACTAAHAVGLTGRAAEPRETVGVAAPSLATPPEQAELWGSNWVGSLAETPENGQPPAGEAGQQTVEWGQ